MAYGIEIRNANNVLVITSESDVILNEETVGASTVTTPPSTTVDVTVEDIQDPTKVLFALSRASGASSQTVTTSTNTLSITNPSPTTSAIFDLFVYRIG